MRSYLVDIWDCDISYINRECSIEVYIRDSHGICISSWGTDHWIDNYQLGIL